MRDAAAVLDELLNQGEQIRRAEATLKALKTQRDDLIFEANDTFVVPISTIATALGIRRETVVNAKLRAQYNDLARRQQ